MKKVLLLGDSIMYGAKGIHGYGFYVKRYLEGIADVILPTDNCQDVRYTLTYLDELVPENETNIDIIHWNNGLWDVLHFAGSPIPYTPLPIYEQKLSECFSVLKRSFPMAKIYFSTTTPIPEHLQKTSSYRKNEEIILFNKSAIETLSGMVDGINDLYTFALRIGDEYRSKDGLHHSEQGSELLSEAVGNFLQSHLK